jgi:hypothetical protein
MILSQKSKETVPLSSFSFLNSKDKGEVPLPLGKQICFGRILQIFRTFLKKTKKIRKWKKYSQKKIQ